MNIRLVIYILLLNLTLFAIPQSLISQIDLFEFDNLINNKVNLFFSVALKYTNEMDLQKPPSSEPTHPLIRPSLPRKIISSETVCFLRSRHRTCSICSVVLSYVCVLCNSAINTVTWRLYMTEKSQMFYLW